MMIPTISIDVVSMPVTRDGTNLLSNMPLGEVASQVLEQGAAFEAAVEQFQQIMAEFQPTEIGESAPIPLQTEEEGSDKSVVPPNVPLVETFPAAPTAETAPASELSTSSVSVVSNTPTEIVEAAPMPIQTEVEGSDKSVASPVASSTPVAIVEAAPMPIQTEVEGSDKSVASPVASSTPVAIGESALMPLQAEVEGSDKRVTSPNVPLVETSPAAPITGTFPAAPTAETVPASELGTSPMSVESNTSAEIGEAALMPLQEGVKGSDKSVASPNVPLVETSLAAPTTGVPPAVSSAGTSPAAPTTGTVSATELGTSPISVVSNAPTKIVEAAPMPLQTEQVGSDKRVFSPNEPSMETSLLDVEGPPDGPVLHAAPVVASAQPQVIDVKDVAVEPVQVVAARVAHQVETTPAQVLIEAASAVADTIVVSPGLLRGGR